MKTYHSILESIGCNDYQVKIFETLRKYGAKPAGTIAKIVGLERTHSYKMLDQMVGRGIVAKSKTQGATSYFIPSESVLDQYYDNQQAVLEQSKALLPQAYEELAALGSQTVGHKPLYRIREGHDGMGQMFETIIHQLQQDQLSVIKIIALSTLEHVATTSHTLADYAGILFDYCDKHHISIQSTVGTGVMIPESITQLTQREELASLPAGQSSLYVIVVGTNTYFAVFKTVPLGFKRELVELADLFHFFAKVVGK